MSETFAEKVIRIQHEQNVSAKLAGRAARAEIHIEERLARRKLDEAVRSERSFRSDSQEDI